MASNEKKNAKGYFIFTTAMILCCIGLYLGQRLTAAHAAPEPVPTITPVVHDFPAEPAFLENAAAFGMHADWETADSPLPATSVYILSRPGLEDARLSLSIQGGGVCAFLLEMPLVKDPGELAANATPIEADLYAMAMETYQEEQAWRQAAVQALCAALDPAGSCASTEISRFCALVEETDSKGSAREDRAGELAFSSYILPVEQGECLCASASRVE